MKAPPQVVYCGIRSSTPGPVEFRVHSGLGDASEPLPPRNDLANHSPDGFNYGFNGSGPAQLALALLAHRYGDDYAIKNYQRFKSEEVAKWQAPMVMISGEELDGMMGIKP